MEIEIGPSTYLKAWLKLGSIVTQQLKEEHIAQMYSGLAPLLTGYSFKYIHDMNSLNFVIQIYSSNAVCFNDTVNKFSHFFTGMCSFCSKNITHT